MSLNFLFPITTSSRYVFYQSLIHKNYSQSPEYLQAAIGASRILNNRELTTNDKEQEENKMQQVINLLEIALQKEQEAEKNFLNKNFINNPIFKPYKKFCSEISAFYLIYRKNRNRSTDSSTILIPSIFLVVTDRKISFLIFIGIIVFTARNRKD